MTIKTKIHGKMYDLTKFNHPGGTIPLYLLDGKDGTCLFESYHPVSNRQMLKKILSKYEIPDDNSIQEQQIYDFKQFDTNPFVLEVRTAVLQYFKNIAHKRNCSLIKATKISPLKLAEILSQILLLIGLNVYYFYNDSALAFFLNPIFYFSFLVNNWHDCSHFAFICNKKIEYIVTCLFISPENTPVWYKTHGREHHCYSNIVGIDQDIDQYKLKKKKKRWKNKIFKVFFSFFEKILFSNAAEDKELFEFRDIYIFQTILNLLIRSILFTWLIYKSNSLVLLLIKIIVFYIIMLIQFIIVTQINHIHKVNFVSNKNYYKHQIITAYNVSPSSHFMRFLTGGLNCQIEHHLFPSVNSCHLPALSKIIKPLCKKYNIKYNESPSLLLTLYDTYKTIQNIHTIKN